MHFILCNVLFIGKHWLQVWKVSMWWKRVGIGHCKILLTLKWYPEFKKSILGKFLSFWMFFIEQKVSLIGVFLVHIFLHLDWFTDAIKYGQNRDQKKLRIRILFSQCFGKDVLSSSDYLSQCRQSSSLSANERQEITKHVFTRLVAVKKWILERVIESSDGEKKLSTRLLQSMLYLETENVHIEKILAIMNISMTIPNCFIASITLRMLATLLEISKNDLINPIIRVTLKSNSYLQKNCLYLN